MNLENKEDYRLMIEIIFYSQKPLHPIINYLYYEEFGPEEKFKEAKSMLDSLVEKMKPEENFPPLF